jgi:hypothetical protein
MDATVNHSLSTSGRQPLRPVVAMPRIMNFWETA